MVMLTLTFVGALNQCLTVPAGFCPHHISYQTQLIPNVHTAKVHFAESPFIYNILPRQVGVL